MLTGKGKTIVMVQGDYGIELPIRFKGVSIGQDETIEFRIINKIGETKIRKTYANIQDNTIALEFTQQETSLLKPADYKYSIDLYKNGVFLANIVNCSEFKVEVKC